jgi:hypothetical protein
MRDYSARPTALPSLQGTSVNSGTFDPVQEILASGRVLFGNLVLTVPTIVAIFIPGLIAIIFGAVAVVGELMASKQFAEPDTIGTFFTPAVLTGMGLAAILFIVLSILATGAVYDGAARVLAGRAVDVQSLMASGLKHAGSVFVFYLIFAIVAILVESIVVLLGLISYGILGGIALFLFLVAGAYASFLFIYALPALIVHARSPFDAMRESAALARANVNSTLILILAWLLLASASFIVNASFAFVPVFGQIVGLAVHGLCTALMALFSVHFYRLLLGQATPFGISAGLSGPPAAAP